MEIGQLLNAIVEVSQSVARMPCPPAEKDDVLAGDAASSSKPNPNGAGDNDQTQLKEILLTTGAGNVTGRDQMEEKLQNMDSKLCTLEQKLNSVVGTEDVANQSLSCLTKEFVAHTTTISLMRNAHDNVCNRVSHIEKRSKELEKLQNRVEQVGAMVESSDSTSTGLQDELLKLHREIADLEDSVQRSVIKDFESSVAFSASTVYCQKKYLPGQIIEFSHVGVNYSNCYNQNTSMFNCESLGLYFFTTSINTNTDGNFTAAIVHNRQEVCLFGTSGKKDLQTGSSVVLLLKPGDKVCVKVNMQSNSSVGVEIGSGFSNFTGYKLN